MSEVHAKLRKHVLRVEVAKKAPPFKEAVKLLAGRGISLKKVDDEYVVNYRGGKEATAYFTNDLNDAISTGMYMAEHPENQSKK